MIARINKLITLLIIVGLALYLVLYNSQDITLTLAPSWQFSGNAGVIYLSLFVAGIVLTSVFGIFWGLKAYFRERKLINNDNQRKAFYRGMIKARALYAAREWHRATVEWEALAKKDPTDIIAKLEISRCLEHIGGNAEALKLIEAARSTAPKNIEVLFRAAELQRNQGNRTAAIDNLALILEQGPNKRAAILARNLSEELGNYEAALRYQEILESYSGPSEELENVRARIEFKILIAKPNSTKTELLQELRTFSKKKPHFVPALQRLALLEAEIGSTEEAAASYAKAAKQSVSSAYWNEIAKLWLQRGQPEKALAAARTATKETIGEAKLISELDLLRIQIQLQQLDEAQKTISQLETTFAAKSSAKNIDIMQQLFILKGNVLSQLGKYNEAAQIWKQLAQQDFSINNNHYIPGNSHEDPAPAARLSTP